MLDEAFVEQLRERLAGLEQKLAQPEVVANRKAFLKLIGEHTTLKKRLEHADAFLKLRCEVQEQKALLADEQADSDLREIAAEEIGELETRLGDAERDLKIALLPPDPTEERSAIVEIRAGTGGEEAGLFAGDLFRMYSRHAETRGWKTKMIHSSASSLGGFKEVVFSVAGENVYRALQYESGVHRVQRVPVTESSGRIHTSAATVAVFPEADESDEIELDPEELRIDIFCSSGPGGQSVNTTYSAVRVTHLPTGLVAQSQDERSQHRNKERALSVLRARLLDHRRREQNERLGNARRSLIGSGDRSEKIRTYNFPQNRVTDHRVNITLYSLDRIMAGELAELLNGLYNHDIETRIRRELSSTDADADV